MRVKRGVVRHRRHKKIRALAKGYRGMRRSTFVKANEAVIRAGVNAYVSRKLKKRDFRALWITRLSAALKTKGIRYSAFIDQMAKKKIVLNRKALSELAIHHPGVFEKVVESVCTK
ncbi:50S ribosomal protein L20 [Candidatus Peregrinibacteria bacterium]|nr:50S ribosomal protein L20 [Candidatus Peregrinibacteria bacterium]